MDRFKVVLTDYEFEDFRFEEKVFKSSGLNINFVKAQCKTEEEVIQIGKDADALLNQYAPVGEKVINELEKCKVISRYGVGVNTIDVQASTNKGIFVSNVPDYGVEEVSNHALALLLSSARKITQLNAHIKSGQWDFKLATPIYRFSKQTLGVLGFGRIPRVLVKKAQPLGFQILVHDPFVPEDDIRQMGAKPVPFEELLTASDFISIHVPLVESTKHLINKHTIRLMKKNAVIINTARGPIINENDLADALKNRQIAGAALDVAEEEPIPKDSPLLTMSNVILTPHSSWYSEEAMEELRTKTAQNVIEVLSGKKPTYFVNKELEKLSSVVK
ncbi:C-terminal binding protein [Peribacillus cavernae]|uniref:C-terminal binding protein n=1 Tax=Peribacillus cavernae TaxID=1674310 RepID=A0A3S0W523_9BACI|nr:C-terminal binding protein [Peribacillus cavernae]MDQ0218067.1 D-3-phosphoglycerate dehydrogenase [Peribacillus cavernae]RUQ32773.1 C-terminal binding protein [Peribacillus cavernae]